MKFDWKTALLVLGAVALGYAICLAMPVVQADSPLPAVVDQLVVTDQLTVSEIVADRIIVRQSILSEGTIGFVSGPILTGTLDRLYIKGITYFHDGIGNYYDIKCKDVYCGDIYARGNIYRNGTMVISNAGALQNVTIAAGVTGGSGLDVGKLEGNSAADFVLKSEIDENFCQTFCSIKPELEYTLSYTIPCTNTCPPGHGPGIPPGR